MSERMPRRIRSWGVTAAAAIAHGKEPRRSAEAPVHRPHVELPRAARLRDITRLEGIDVATSVLYEAVFGSAPHAPFIKRIDELRRGASRPVRDRRSEVGDQRSEIDEDALPTS